MKKWKRLLGLKLKRNEEEGEEGEKLKRHGGGGGLRVRRERILRGRWCGVV